jgi:hypothetical protein
MTESAYEKGRRYLVEGRLVVTRVDGDEIRATCRGGGTAYALGHTAGRWFCGCPARTTCAHLVALQLVVSLGPSRPS